MTKKFLFLSLFFCIQLISFGSNESLIYFSPRANSIRVSEYTEIILRPKDDYIQQYINDPPQLNISGSSSGNHQYTLYVSPDKRSYVYKLMQKFKEGERVTVTSSSGPINTDDDYNIYFLFTISNGDLNNTIIPEELLREELLSNLPQGNRDITSVKTINSKVPDDMHALIPVSPQVTRSNDFYFTGTCLLSPPFNSYIMILDAYGTPIFYKKLYGANYDFKKQDNGLLTFYDGHRSKFKILDNNYNLIDSVRGGYGYKTDFHELLIDENGHYLYFCYDKQKVDMSQIVAGGNPEATVHGLILQERDENQEIIFQWRSWDYYSITDAADAVDLTQASIDYVHGNSISIDHDNNLVISLRNCNQVIKIDRRTGDFIYRMGGKHNQFTFINENYEFDWQHDARILPNGNLTIYDNGGKRTPKFTRGIEYAIDEVNKTAELVWEYNPSPSVYAGSMCNLQTLPDGNRLMSWAGWGGRGFSEISEDGTMINDYDIEDAGRLYRVFKDSWETNFLTASPTNIVFQPGDENQKDTAEVAIRNNTFSSITINQVVNQNEAFRLLTEVPFTIEPGLDKIISVEFSPGKNFVTFVDHLTLCEDTPELRRSVRVQLTGTIVTKMDSNQSLPDKTFEIDNIYPNPFNPTTNLAFSIAQAGNVSLEVYDITGKTVLSHYQFFQAGSHNLPITLNNMASGIYFVTIAQGNKSFIQKIMLLK